MNPEHVKAYLTRGWAAAAALKGEHWAREYGQRGPEATLAAAHALWQQMRLLRPDWPTDDERRDDLDHHVALKRAIDLAARAFAAHGRR